MVCSDREPSYRVWSLHTGWGDRESSYTGCVVTGSLHTSLGPICPPLIWLEWPGGAMSCGQ